VAQQITEAFPWDSAPRNVIRDRDSVYGALVRARIKAMGIEEVVTAPRSPWQNPYVERMIGSIRRECLDHLIVVDARHLRRILASYLDYCHRICPPPPTRGHKIRVISAQIELLGGTGGTRALRYEIRSDGYDFLHFGIGSTHELTAEGRQTRLFGG
jgi:transposase InsO family protein